MWPVLRRFALRVESSGNVVLVTTPSGCANALAQAIDDSLHPDVLGTVAGDNTILVLAREGVAGATLRDELRGQQLEGAA
jgi:transcriptional regulator of arginine metabolism